MSRAEGKQTKQMGVFLAVGAAVVAAVVAAVIFWPAGRVEQPVITPVSAEEKQEVKDLYESGNYKKALPDLRKMVEQEPENTELRTMLASALWLDGDLEKAQDEYENILEIDPDNADSRYRLGLLLRQRGETAEAVEELEKAVELRSGSALFLSELAKTYVKLGRHDEAIDKWRLALKTYSSKNPARAGVHAEIGDTLVLMGQREEARKAYAAGLKIDPNNNYLNSQLNKI